MENPMNMLKTMMSAKSPQQMVLNMLSNNNNPMFNNLIDMAKSGNTKSLENFARNICKQRNVDFDKEFSSFMSNLKS